MPDTPPRAEPSPVWRLHLWQIQPVRDLLVIATIVALIYLGYRLSLVTVPMLLALLLAYLFEPLVRAMVRTPVFSRPGAAILIIVGAVAVFVVPATIGLGTAVIQGGRAANSVARTSGDLSTVIRFSQRVLEEDKDFGRVDLRYNADQPALSTATFIPAEGTDKPQHDAQLAAPKANVAYQRLPTSLRSLAARVLKSHEDEAKARAEQAAPSESAPRRMLPATRMPDLSVLLDTSIAWIQDNAVAVSETLGKSAIGTGAEAFSVLLRTFRGLAKLGLTLFLTAVFFYFFSTGWGRVLSFWEGLIPERKKGRVIYLVEKMDRVIAGFVRGRLTICAILMIYYTTAYWLVGVPAPLLLGPIAGAFALVPFLTTLAIPIAIILMALQPSDVAWQQNWWWILGAPFLVYFIDRVVDDYILTPAIQKHHTEMAIPAILFASLAGGILAGVYGLLIAIPVAACVRILLKEIFWPRFKAWAEGRERDFLPIGHLDEPGPPPSPVA